MTSRSSEPEKLRQLVDLWWAEAGKHNVLPLDDRILERFLVRPPNPVTSRERFVYYPGVYIPGEAMPNIKNVSYSVTSTITRADASGDGIVAACGDATLGFALYVKDGHLVHHYNAAGDHYRVESDVDVPVGECTVRYEFTKTGDLEGIGSLFIDGKAGGQRADREDDRRDVRTPRDHGGLEPGHSGLRRLRRSLPLPG